MELKKIKMQDWQKEILEMTEGQELAPLFKPKNHNSNKLTNMKKDKRFKIKHENAFILMLVILSIFTSCLFYCERAYLFIKNLFKKK